MSRKIIFLTVAVLGLFGVSLAAYGVEKSEFVSKCMWNGRDYKPCACTYNALPDLPDAYADLAVSWAHDPPSAYRISYIKTLAKDLVPGGGGRKTRYGLKAPVAEPSYIGGLIKSLGTSVAVKWIVSLLPGVDGGTSYVVTSATKATGKFGYARYVFDKHCGKRLQTMANELSRLTGTVADTTTKTVKHVSDGIVEAARSVTESTSEATKSALDYLEKSVGLD